MVALQYDSEELKELGEYVSQYRGFKKNIFPCKNESGLSTLWTTDMPTHTARRSRGELQGRKQHVKSAFFSPQRSSWNVSHSPAARGCSWRCCLGQTPTECFISTVEGKRASVV